MDPLDPDVDPGMDMPMPTPDNAAPPMAMPNEPPAKEEPAPDDNNVSLLLHCNRILERSLFLNEYATHAQATLCTVISNL